MGVARRKSAILPYLRGAGSLKRLLGRQPSSLLQPAGGPKRSEGVGQALKLKHRRDRRLTEGRHLRAEAIDREQGLHELGLVTSIKGRPIVSRMLPRLALGGPRAQLGRHICRNGTQVVDPVDVDVEVPALTAQNEEGSLSAQRTTLVRGEDQEHGLGVTGQVGSLLDHDPVSDASAGRLRRLVFSLARVGALAKKVIAAQAVLGVRYDRATRAPGVTSLLARGWHDRGEVQRDRRGCDEQEPVHAVPRSTRFVIQP